MENAKDTFYITLRNRLAVLNPDRIIIMRSLQRPGIVMEDAESAVAQIPSDVFVLRWTALNVDTQMSSGLAEMACEIHYTTGGTQANAGLDRGRALAEMDGELLTILSPAYAQKMDFTQTPAVAKSTKVFWTGAQFTPTTILRERLTRIAKVAVFSFQEQGEL